ncbi:hypothetical protein H4R21_004835 [Coemansia helicoidea]|uniref:Uncharacterized protein n=1 Tax=Coemansia helicoidea TaxID=1286919 RepID=A0ACC1KW39_9FUNG|nr:hypothetical protein H4R21_004835 [Coemansia helicoidea]
MSVAVGTDFGFCVMIAIGMAIQCEVAAMEVDVLRKQCNMPHPDGSGEQLEAQPSDEDRAKFNRAKYVHDSYREHLPTAVLLLLLAGLFHPAKSTVVGMMYIPIHAVYNWFYTRGKLEICMCCMPFIRGLLVAWGVIALQGATALTIFA